MGALTDEIRELRESIDALRTIMLATANDDITVLSVELASKLTGRAPETIKRAMDAWTLSHGRLGLAWMSLTGTRREIRKSALVDWMRRSELDARHG